MAVAQHRGDAAEQHKSARARGLGARHKRAGAIDVDGLHAVLDGPRRVLGQVHDGGAVEDHVHAAQRVVEHGGVAEVAAHLPHAGVCVERVRVTRSDREIKAPARVVRVFRD